MYIKLHFRRKSFVAAKKKRQTKTPWKVSPENTTKAHRCLCMLEEMYTRGIADGGCCGGWARCRVLAGLCCGRLQHWGGTGGPPVPWAHPVPPVKPFAPSRSRSTKTLSVFFFFFFFSSVCRFCSAFPLPPPPQVGKRMFYTAAFSPNNLKSRTKGN